MLKMILGDVQGQNDRNCHRVTEPPVYTASAHSMILHLILWPGRLEKQAIFWLYELFLNANGSLYKTITHVLKYTIES